MTGSVRVRYAPSPTGFPHVGNIRTAIFNWLFARHHGGTFFIRIEDTDTARTVPGSLEAILNGLRWLGMDWDEGPDVGGPYGPYFQSQRLAYYQEAARRLVEQGKAYYCYCSPERLEQMRKDQIAHKQPPGYDRHCRNLTPLERAQKEAEGIKPVVRFKMPLSGQTRFTDLIRGEVVFEHSTLDDHILLKSDGYPTYHLAHVVDDYMMKTTHVIRGEEWLSSTPRHLLLWEAMGYEPPFYAHLPLILGTDRSKLSKRHGAATITEYAEQGYLPEAMFNFLTLLGWSLDDKTEIMSVDQIIQNFSIERISPTAAIFNIEKLQWMNGVYIRKLSPEAFYEKARPFLERDKDAGPMVKRDESYVRKAIALAQDRARTLVEVADLVRFCFVDELEYSPELLIEKNMDVPRTVQVLSICHQRLSQVEPFDAVTLEQVLRPMAAELGLKTGQLFGVLRTATTGRTAAPPLFQTMEVLGKQRTLDRIKAAIVRLSG